MIWVESPDLTNTAQATSDVSNALTSISQLTDPKQKIEQLTLVGGQLSSISNAVTNTSSSSLCLCSGHGQCNAKSECICNSGYRLSDCSMTEEDFNNLQNLKADVLKELENSLDSLGSDADKGMALNLIADLSSNQDLNTQDSILKTQSLLDKIVNSGSSNASLTESESQKVVQTVDQLISYAGGSDCAATGLVTAELKNTTKDYLQKTAQGFLEGTIVGDKPTIKNTDNYNIYLQKVTPCTLSEREINFLDANAPKLRLSPKTSELDCTRELILKIYVFNGNIFNCDSQAISAKDRVIIEIIDSDTNEDISS